MSWIRRSPFADGTDPAEHMVALIAAEAERSGTPFSEADREALLKNWEPDSLDSDTSGDFPEKVKKFIVQTFDHETDPDDPRSLGNSLMWAGERNYSLIVALTEEIMRERGESSPLRGRRRDG